MPLILPLAVIVIDIFLLSVVLLLCLLMITWVVSFYMDVPFVPTPSDAFPKIKQVLRLGSGDVVYELGSGDGRFLLACALREPRARFIGIERNPLLYTYSLFRKHLAGNPSNLTFLRASFFDIDLSGATKIYAYLLDPIMDALLPKFERELSHARIASRAFKFSKKDPAETLRLSEQPGSHNQHMLYVYDF